MFWNIVLGIAAFALNLLLSPKPQNAKPASLADFGIPTAEEGLEIPVAFGSVWIYPNTVWYGDLNLQPITGPRRYGFFGPRQITGYRYSLGMHMVLCHSVHDRIWEIWAEKKLFPKSPSTLPFDGTGIIVIDQMDIYGGDEAGGGVFGPLGVLGGGAGQTVNPYLEEHLAGDDTPAFRGVVSLLWMPLYIGNSPYIKPWQVFLRRLYKTATGDAQWYPEKAGIPEGESAENLALYFALDCSIADEFGLTYTRIAVKGALAKLEADGTDVDIHMVAFGATIQDSIEIRGVDAAGYDALEAWLDALTGDDSNPDFDEGVSEAGAFFAGSGGRTRRILMLTDGGDGTSSDATVSDANATIAGIGDVEVYGFTFARFILTSANLEAMDNTPDDQQPVTGYCPVYLTNSDALFSALGAETALLVYDMNPAHIIRECLTDRTWGMGYADADIDDDAFRAAADTLYDEPFGMSLLWTREQPLDEFISMVLSHIDAYLYLRRDTGKFFLKLVRNDYVVDDLPIFTEDDVVSWDEVTHRGPPEAINTVTVKWTDRANQGKDAATSYDNIAQIQQIGARIPATRFYPGITKGTLASSVARRDQRTLGVGLINGSLTGHRTFDTLYPGDPFRLVSARHNIDGEVFRVAELKFGDGRKNAIGVKFLQDIFRLNLEDIIDTSGSDWENPVTDPEPVEPRLVWEMPYFELTQMIGPASTASMLATDPDAGMIEIAGAQPSGVALQADIYVDGTDTDEVLNVWAPAGTLATSLTNSPLTGTFTLTDEFDVANIEEDMLGALIDPDDPTDPTTIEIVQVLSIDTETLIVSIARGMLDTVPKAHPTGTWFVVFDDFVGMDGVQRTAGDTPSTELLTRTASALLSTTAAPDDVVTLDSRAIRPLRPADVKVDGEDGSTGLPVDVTATDPFTVTWANRDRLTESTPLLWTAPDTGLESGATITIALIAADGTTIIDDTTYAGLTGTSQNIDHADFLGEAEAFVRFTTERDGYGPWQYYQIPVSLGALLLLEGDMTDGDDNLLLEGDMTDGNDLLVI